MMGRSAGRSKLLEPGERWGWEYRLVAQTTGEPVEPASLALPVPPADWAPLAADRLDRAVAYRSHCWWAAIGAAVLAAVGVALVGVGVPLLVPLALALVALVAVGLAVLPALLAVRGADAAYRSWLDEVRTRTAPTAAEPSTTAAVGQWRPVAPGSAERVDVYGGTDRGRAALLSTVAGSVLGSGGAVTVLDLTGESAARELVRVAGTAGHRLDLLSLPDHLPAVGLLSDLAPAQVGTVLADAVHAVDRDPDSGDRSGDAALAGQAVAALSSRGPGDTPDARPLTFRRVAAALRALNGSDSDGALTATERASLAAAHRAPGNLAAGPRLRRLAAAASQLAIAEEHDPGVRPYRDPHAQLRVMQLLGTDPDLSSDLLAQVLAGVLLHQVRRQVPAEGAARLLVVVGADGLRRAQLERLEALTARRGIRLVLAYRRLRGDAAAPGDRHATILMRQDTAAEAAYAAELTGEEPLLTADTTVQDTGRLPAPPPIPAPPPHPCQAMPAPTRHPGTRYAPTRDFFRSLPETAAVLIDPRDTGSPRLIDYDPPV